METIEKIRVGKQDYLKTLYAKRDLINNEIRKALQTHKSNKHPEAKAEGPVYYYYTPFHPNKPRVTVAAHVNTRRGELHYGVRVADSRDQFCKATGRIRAMGLAVSTKRKIMKLKSTDHKYVRERIAEVAEMTQKLSFQKRKDIKNGKKN